MGKRFTDTEKWKDKGFRSLTPIQKLLFIYLLDNCDNAGFIEVDIEFWSYQLKTKEHELLCEFNDMKRTIEVVGSWCWIPNFIKHQKNLPLNKSNNAHKQIISLIEEHKSKFIASLKFKQFLGANEGLNSPIGKGIVKVKVKVKESDLLENRRLIESQCRLHQCKEDEIKRHISRFYLKNYASSETDKTLEEIISHCTNWLAKQDIKKYIEPQKHWNEE